MKLEPREMVGWLLIIASAQFLVGGLMLAESIAPEYSMHDNAISDLGTIDETRYLFGGSLALFGLLVVITAYYFYRIHKSKLLLVIFALGGIGAIGAGLIPLDSKIGLHGLFALLAFLFGNLEGIFTARLVKNPLKAFSILMGVIGIIFLVVMVLTDSEAVDPSGSIGHGGVERMIAYPLLIWYLIFGGYLLSSPRLTIDSQSAQAPARPGEV